MPRISWKLIGEFLNSARENDVTELRLLLDSYPILINALDAQGRNALSVAGGREATEFLVEHGAVDPAAARRDAASAVKRYLATGDVRRLVEHVYFHEVVWDAVEHDLRLSNTTMFHLALPYPDVIGHLLDWLPAERLNQRTETEGERRDPGTTPLQATARRGLAKTAQRLAEKGVDYDAFSAVALNDIAHLATRSADDLERADSNNASLLHWASLHGSVDVVGWLVDNGLDINAVNAFGEKPLVLSALARDYPGTANTDDRTGVIRLLKDRGARMDVFAAAALGDEQSLIAFLAADSGQAHTTNRFGSTPLHYAAWAGKEDAAKGLLHAGANVNAKDQHGRSPLFYAACWGRHRSMVELLLKNDADTRLRDVRDKDISAYDNVIDGDGTKSSPAPVIPFPTSLAGASHAALIRQLRSAFAWRPKPGKLFDSIAYTDGEQAFMDVVSAFTPDELSFNEGEPGGVDRWQLWGSMPLMSTDGLLYCLGSFLAMHVADYNREDVFLDAFLWRFRCAPFVSWTVSEWPDEIAGLRDADKVRAMGEEDFEEHRLSKLQDWFFGADPTRNRLIARMTKVERQAVACFIDFLATKEGLDSAGPETHAARAMLRGWSLGHRLGARTKSECRSLVQSLELLESNFPSHFPPDRTRPLKAAL